MTLQDGFPPFYHERHSSVTMSNETLYLIYSISVLISTLMIILPGFRSFERVLFGIHWSLSLLIGGSLVACIFGSDWQVAEQVAEIPFYRSGEALINASIGLKIGLRSFNVTLKGLSGSERMSDVTYSEKYFFLTTDEQLTYALTRGLPSSILNVVEHFSGNRINSIWPWSRRYWTVGHFSLYLLWSAFALWLLFNILIHAVVKFGSSCLLFTGLLMLLANITFASITRFGTIPLTIGDFKSNTTLQLRFGWSFWLCLAVGFLCILWGVFLIFLDFHNPKAVRLFFNIETEKGLEFNEVAQQNFDPSNLINHVRKKSLYFISTHFTGSHNSSFENHVTEDVQIKIPDVFVEVEG